MKFIPDQFPFAVVFAIYVKGVVVGGGGFKRFCGGTMVHDGGESFSWAISAAHCFLDANMYVVMEGYLFFCVGIFINVSRSSFMYDARPGDEYSLTHAQT